MIRLALLLLALALLLFEGLVEGSDALVGADGAGREADEGESPEIRGAREGNVGLPVLKCPVEIHLERRNCHALRLVNCCGVDLSVGSSE